MPENSGLTFERDLLREFMAALEALPDLKVSSSSDAAKDPTVGLAADFQIALESGGREVVLLVEAKSYGYPRDLRDAAEQLSKYVAARPELSVVPVIIASAISPGGRELLRHQGIGYWDRSGSLYLKLPSAMFYIEKPQQTQAPRTLRGLYRGSAAQVLHALLLEPRRAWHVNELALQAKVSTARTYWVLTELERHLWVEKRGSGPETTRHLVDPGALLDSWADAHSLKEYSFYSFYGWSQSPPKLRSSVTSALDRHEIPYALTLTSGAELVAPFAVGNERLELLVQDHREIEDAAKEAGLKLVDAGDNVAFLLTKERSPLLFRQQIDGMQVASTIQLYLDLWASPRRGKEQAKHLRAERLSF
jgi:hypothetical protein